MLSKSVLSFLLLCALAFPAWAENGVTDTKIIFGQTAALEGPASALGIGMRAGILAAFHEINQSGGVKGRQLELISYNDGYEPEQAIENTQVLIERDNVFSLIGGVGTPTANAIQPIASRAGVPFIAPFTGAEFLRNPFKRYVVNVRASYWQETEEWIERLTTDLGIKRIAIMYQDDSYGRAGLSGVEQALERRNMSLVGEGTYKRNTVAVKSAALRILESDPEAIVMIGAYQPCAEFIKLVRALGADPLFVNISFVGSEALSERLGDDAEGVIISEVVPFPFEPKGSKLVKSYQSAMNAYDPDMRYGFISLEGYIAGRLVMEVLKEMSGDITRESFLDALYVMKNITIDDLDLHFGPGDNQGMDHVFMTVLGKDKKFTSVETLSR